MWSKVSLLGFIICLCVYSTVGQTCCSAGAPISSSFDIGSSDTRGIAFQLNYEYNSVNLLVDNDQKLVNDPRTRNGQNVLLKTDYILNKNWAFSAYLPLVIQNRTTISAEENTSGLGDLTVMGQYSNYISETTALKLSAGIKTPTGKQYITDDVGIHLSPDMQSGSGTFDFIGRLALIKQHVFTPNLTHQLSISHKKNTTNNHFGDPNRTNGRAFKFGNETQVTAAFSYLLVAKSWFLIPELGLKYRHTSPNVEAGFESFNSGGDWLILPFAVQVQPNTQWSIRAFGEVPIQQDLNGLQITTDYKIGLQIRHSIQIRHDTNVIPEKYYSF